MGVMPDRGDGACIHLSENNQCKIYDNRPEICNVEKMYQKWKVKFPALERKEYFKQSNKVCNQWMDEEGIPSSYRINVNDYDST